MFTWAGFWNSSAWQVSNTTLAAVIALGPFIAQKLWDFFYPYDVEFSKSAATLFEKDGWKIKKRPGGLAMPSLVGNEVILCEDSDNNLVLFCESPDALRQCKHIKNAVGQKKSDIFTVEDYSTAIEIEKARARYYATLEPPNTFSLVSCQRAAAPFWWWIVEVSQTPCVAISNCLVDLLGRTEFDPDNEHIRIVKLLSTKGEISLAFRNDGKITQMPVRRAYSGLLDEMIGEWFQIVHHEAGAADVEAQVTLNLDDMYYMKRSSDEFNKKLMVNKIDSEYRAKCFESLQFFPEKVYLKSIEPLLADNVIVWVANLIIWVWVLLAWVWRTVVISMILLFSGGIMRNYDAICRKNRGRNALPDAPIVPHGNDDVAVQNQHRNQSPDDEHLNLVFFVDGLLINYPREYKPYSIENNYVVQHFIDDKHFRFFKCFFMDGKLRPTVPIDRLKLTNMLKILSFSVRANLALHTIWLSGKIGLIDFQAFCIQYFSFLNAGFRIFRFHKGYLRCVFRRDFRGNWRASDPFDEGGAIPVTHIFMEAAESAEMRVLAVGDLCSDKANIDYMRQHNVITDAYAPESREALKTLIKWDKEQKEAQKPKREPDAARQNNKSRRQRRRQAAHVEEQEHEQVHAAGNISTEEVYRILVACMEDRKDCLRRDWNTPVYKI